MLDDRQVSFLEVACRDTTNENEAITALRHFRKSVANADLRQLLQSPPAAGASGSLTSYKNKVRELEEALEAREEEVEDLRRAVSTLKRDVRTANESLTETAMERDSLLQSNLVLEDRLKVAERKLLNRDAPEPATNKPNGFASFEEAITRKLGKSHGWRAAVTGASRFTYQDFRNWETDNEVPPEAFALIDQLSTTKAPPFKWSENKLKRLQTLIDEGKKVKEITSLLSSEYGVELRPTAVKGIIQTRLRN